MEDHNIKPTHVKPNPSVKSEKLEGPMPLHKRLALGHTDILTNPHGASEAKNKTRESW